MIPNKELIEETISLQESDKDPVQQFSTRKKTSSEWSELEPYSEEAFQRIYEEPIIDGVKLKFKSTLLIINGRHSNKNYRINKN